MPERLQDLDQPAEGHGPGEREQLAPGAIASVRGLHEQQQDGNRREDRTVRCVEQHPVPESIARDRREKQQRQERQQREQDAGQLPRPWIHRCSSAAGGEVEMVGRVGLEPTTY